jgi:psp operon transcriptional activator
MKTVYKRSSMTASTEALGQSEVFLEFQERISRAAPINRPVLLAGERGTGKELAASRLHYLSGRWQRPLVTLNCAALTPTLIESELFGYERGAFTGALQRRSGRFEAADGGTLFLDEIGNVPAEVQEKILRVVEYTTFERVGSTETIEVDVRIVAATHVDLRERVDLGRFKQDLLDRLSFEVLFVPPLRERKGDILLLARHFAARMAAEMGRAEIPEFTTEAAAALEDYGWPGNVRELKNVVERAVYRSTSHAVAEVDFDPFASPFTKAPAPQPPRAEQLASLAVPRAPIRTAPLDEAVWELKVNMLESALGRAEFNQRKAAALLGLSYDRFRGLYRRYKSRRHKAV